MKTSKKSIKLLLFTSILLSVIFTAFVLFEDSNLKTKNDIKQEIQNTKNSPEGKIFQSGFYTGNLSQHSFYFSQTGTIYGWGYNEQGQLGNEDTYNSRDVIELNYYWNQVFDTSLIETLHFHNNTVFAFLTDGTIYGWGANGDGELGLGHRLNRNSPVSLTNSWNTYFDPSLIIDFFTNNKTSYAVLSNGEIYAWGDNAFGQLGIGDSGVPREVVPTRVDDDWDAHFDTSQISEIYTNNNTVFVSLDNGEWWGWGQNVNEELGINSPNSREYSPIRLDVEWNNHFNTSLIEDFHVSAGTMFAFLSDGSIYGWGHNAQGTLGIGDTGVVNLPTQLDLLWDQQFNTSLIDQFYVSNLTTIVFLSDGKVYGWGYNVQGQLGNNQSSNRYFLPFRLDTFWDNYFDPSHVVEFHQNSDSAFVFLNDGVNGQIFVWGNNGEDELALGISSPLQVITPTLTLEFKNYNSQWNPNNSLEFSFNYNKAYWGTDDLYYTIYTDDINDPTIPSTLIPGLNNNGTETIVFNTLDLEQYSILISSNSNNTGIRFMQQPLAAPTPSTVNNLIVRDITTTTATIEYTYSIGDGTNQVQYSLNNGNDWTVIPTGAVDGVNTYGITELDPGTQYDIIVAPVENINGSSEATFTTNHSETIISNISTSNITLSSVDISYFYEPGSAATGNIEYSIDNGNTWIAKSAPNVNATNTFNISGLDPLTQYTVIVAPEGEGTSNSDSTIFTTYTPSDVSNVTAFNIQTTSVEISYYYEPGQLATGNIQYSIDGEQSWLIVAAPNIDATNSFTITNLDPGVQYEVIVAPENEENESSDSTIFTTEDSSSEITNVNASNITETSVDISYDYNPGTVATGNIEYSIDNGNSWITESGQISNSTNTFTINNLDPGVQYEVIIVPEGEGMENSASTIFNTLDSDSIISNVSSSDITQTSVDISYFYEPGSLATGNIEYSIDNGNSWEITSAPNDNATNTFTIINLDPGTEYIVIVAPENEGTANSSSTTFTTLDSSSVISNVTTSNVYETSADISYYYSPGTIATGNIEYSIDNENTWTIEQAPNINTTNTFTINNLLPDTEYTVIVAPEGEGTSNSDSTTFTTSGTNTIISNVSATNITTNSADINYYYQPGISSTGYIEYSIDNENTWISVAVSNNNAINTFTISNLNPITSYTVIVAPQGEGTTNSDSTTFTTSNTPTIISNVTAINTTTTSAEISYYYEPGTGATGLIQYSIDGGYSWTNEIATNNNAINTFTITNLFPGTEYDVIVAPQGEETTNSDSTTFTTENTASIISNVTVLNYTSTSAEISYFYQPGSGATGNIEYSIDGGNTWTIEASPFVNANNVFVIDNLIPNNEYTIIVAPEGEGIINSDSSTFTTSEDTSINETPSNETWWSDNSWWASLIITISIVILCGVPLTLFFTRIK